MKLTSFLLARIVLVSSVILFVFGCSATHRELRTYSTINHLPLTSVVDMALETMKLMGYQIKNWNDSTGYVYGTKPIDFRLFLMTVNVVTDARGDRSVAVKCVADQVPLGPSDREVQKFHELFNKLAMRAASPPGEVQKTAPVTTPPPEQGPKGFE
jgi:hypothetical protein